MIDYCNNCGTKLRKDGLYCEGCGWKIQEDSKRIEEIKIELEKQIRVELEKKIRSELEEEYKNKERKKKIAIKKKKYDNITRYFKKSLTNKEILFIAIISISITFIILLLTIFAGHHYITNSRSLDVSTSTGFPFQFLEISRNKFLVVSQDVNWLLFILNILIVFAVFCGLFYFIWIILKNNKIKIKKKSRFQEW